MVDAVPRRSPWPENPVIRLDAPLDGAVLTAERVTITGWILGSPDLVPLLKEHEGSVQLLVERLEQRAELHAGMQYAGIGASTLHTLTVVGSNDSSSNEAPPYAASRPILRTLSIGERVFPVLSRGVPEEQRAISLSADLDLSALLADLPHDGSLLRISFTVTSPIDAAHGTVVVGASNPICCVLLPRIRWPEFFGALVSPADGELIISDTLHVEGWACRLNDEVERVEVRVNGELIDNATVSLPSPALAARYPGVESAARGRFILRLPYSRLRSLYPSGGESFSVQTRAVFRSSGELDMHGARFRLVDEKSFLPSESNARGEIEEITTLPSGEIFVRGWCVRRGFEHGTFYLEGRSWRISLVEGEEKEREKGGRVRWVERDDIAGRAPIFARSRPGFEIWLSPDALGAAPGLVRVAYEDDRGRTVLSTPGWEARLGELFSRQNGASTLKDGVSRVLCRAGARARFSGGRSETAERRKTSLLAASANLSTTEGAPKVLYEILRGAVDDGLHAGQVTLISAKDGPLRADLERLGCVVHVIPELECYGMNFARFLRGLERAGELAGQLAPTRILANVVDSFWAPVLGVRLGIPCDWIVHESIDPRAAFPLLDVPLRHLFLEAVRRTDRMIFVAKTTRALYSAVRGAAPSEVIANGVDLIRIEQLKRTSSRGEARRRLGVDGDTKVISIIGTTTERKGQDRFIREMSLLKSQLAGARFRFFIVGAREIPFLDRLREMANEHRLEELTFVPETSDVAQYYLASDLMVIASREEAAPLVSLEALAFGVPLISTSVFGLAEQLTDGETATIFDGEVHGALADAARALLADPARREQLIAGGLRAVKERFSLEQMTSRYLDLLALV